MSEDNERELRDAYEEVNQAIRKVVALEGLNTEYGMVTDWVTVAAIQGFDDEGESRSATLTLTPPTTGTHGCIPTYRIVGLLDLALHEARNSTLVMYHDNSDGDME